MPLQRQVQMKLVFLCKNYESRSPTSLGVKDRLRLEHECLLFGEVGATWDLGDSFLFFIFYFFDGLYRHHHQLVLINPVVFHGFPK